VAALRTPAHMLGMSAVRREYLVSAWRVCRRASAKSAFNGAFYRDF
jgi:hypothetical protein